MEITWYGLSCFRMTQRGVATVVTDPYDPEQTGLAPLKLSADIVTVSHDAPEQISLDAVQGTPYVINGPGEYEVGGVFITGIQMGGQKGADTARSANRSTLYVFDFDSLTVAHLGDLGRMPTQAEIEAIGTVNVALVPIGSGGLNAARAAEVISLLEPKIIIPMNYVAASDAPAPETLSKFLKEMGLNEIEKQPSLKVTNQSLPEEAQVIVLDQLRK